MSQKTQKRYRDYIKRTFLLYIVLALLTMLLLTSTVMSCISWYVTKFQNKRYSEYAAEHIQKEFEFYRDSIQTLCGDAALFSAAKNSDVDKVQKLLKEFTLKSSYRFQYTLLDNERTIISSNLYEMNRQKFYASYDTQSILDEIDENINVPADRISRAGYSNGQETIYQFGGAVHQGGKTAGYLILDISRRDVLNFFSERLVSEVALVDRYQNIIFTTLNTEQFFKDSKGGVIWNCDWESHDDVIVNKKKYFATRLTGEGFGRPELLFYSMTSTSIFDSAIQYGYTILFLAGIIMLYMMLKLTDRISDHSVNELESLLASTHQWSDGNMDYRIPPQPFFEFQSVCDDFNSMMDKVQALIKTNNELHEINCHMELSNVESQFNPHFVFNILETIKCMVLIDPEQACEMIVTFAKLLRYSIHYGHSIIELKTDIEYIEAYLTLQKQRFGSRLNYSVLIPEELMQQKLPKLLLQPLVENAIIHNSEYVQNIDITISGRCDGNCMLLTVSDNGRGISREQLELLSRRMRDGESIGLSYVDKTLRLSYGDEYGLQLISEVNEGCTAVVRIPLAEEPWTDIV